MGSGGESSANIHQRLSEFLATHPDSKINKVDGYAAVIEHPWGDPSVVLFVPDENDADLIDSLNAVLLPNRFSALWHKDSKSLEIIWTAFPVRSPVDDVKLRKFSFKFQGREYECEFGRSSDRLLHIAKSAGWAAASNTGFRNLQSFNMYADNADSEHFKGVLGEPLSFWIRDIEWSEDDVVSLAYHLNFYMSYYDALSPAIMIHSPPLEAATKPKNRFIKSSFPKRISGREIDPIILHMWEAARFGDNARRFLYLYRILEYSSFFYFDSSARSSIRMALSVPDALDDIQGVTESIVMAMQKSKMDEFQRFEAMIREVVDPKLLWSEINANIGSFTTETIFDGGFRVPPMLGVGARESDFLPQGLSVFARTIRDIRNALSHGRDFKTTMVIAPTSHNFEKLQPWVGLAACAAGEVVLFKDVV